MMLRFGNISKKILMQKSASPMRVVLKSQQIQFNNSRTISHLVSKTNVVLDRDDERKDNTKIMGQQLFRRHISFDSLPSTISNLTAMDAGLPLAAFALWFAGNYHITNPDEKLVRTGYFIDKDEDGEQIEISNSAMRLPFQEVQVIDCKPKTYNFDLRNMSKGKVEFELPISVTFAPIHTDVKLLKIYCQKMLGQSEEERQDQVEHILQGEIRVLTANLTIEEMFSGRQKFRDDVIVHCQQDLKQLGLYIVNMNIEEMEDYDENNKYFIYRKQRAIEMANNEAREDVAKATKHGDIAVSNQRTETRIAKAENEKTASVEESKNQIEILKAQADMSRQEADTTQITEVANMRAKQEVLIKEQELQKEIEEKRFEQNIAREKATQLAPAMAHAEAQERNADASYYAKLKEAEGIQKIMEAQASGVEQLLSSCQGNPDLAKFYLGNEAKLWHEVAVQSANAVKDMKPNITQWHTGTNNEGSSSNMLVDMVQGVIPLYSEVKGALRMGEERGKSSSIDTEVNKK